LQHFRLARNGRDFDYLGARLRPTGRSSVPTSPAAGAYRAHRRRKDRLGRHVDGRHHRDAAGGGGQYRRLVINDIGPFK
jgi:hypothetical protein